VETSTLVDVLGGQVEIIPRGSGVPDARQDVLLAAINAVIATNWQSTKSTWWSRDHSPFRDDFGLALFHAGGGIVGYFIYQRLTLDGLPVFYGAGTAVAPAHQGKRCYQTMQAHAIGAAWRALDPRPHEVYVAWRTRNPSIWMSNSRFCRAVTPPLWDGRDDPNLRDASVRLAHLLYPECPLEAATMVMHNVFDDLVELRPRRYPSGSIGDRIAKMLKHPADALFSLGVVHRSTLERLARAADGSGPITRPAR
jgi:hypothetical protein